MDTAKVDIRRLQLLNDRINQCIDALNQVRMSVHGLSHTNPGTQFAPGLNPLAQSQAYGLGYPTFGQVPLNPGFVPGISHTSPFAGSSPFVTGAVPGITPFAGLAHTSPEEAFARPGWTDPFLAARIAQTFPYAQYPVSPVVTIF